MYPVMLSLGEQPVLVIGGGGVALRKVTGLLAEGARVTVVAPAIVRALAELGRAGTVKIEERSYRENDLRGHVLVLAATDDRALNARVASAARAAGVFVNVADDPELCSFHLPARVQRGAMQLAVASAGGAPFVVRRLRQMLERRLGSEWAEWMDAAVRFRQAVRERRLPRAEAEERYDRFFSATVDGERLKARVPSPVELATLLGPPGPQMEPARVGAGPRHATGHGDGGRGRASAGPARPADADARAVSTNGLVSLVGAGPGDPGLVTCRARERLLGADAVVYDRLAAAAIPCELPARVELHCVGKEAGNHPVPQEETNELLVRLARAGKRVVRLKGGDPFVFGRGGEEGEALGAAGVPWEVVPGVTSGIAAAAYAGIPVTHRAEAVRLTLVTAHESKKTDGPQVAWELLARDAHATLVGYMGLTSLGKVAEELLAAGMSPSTPAAVVSQGTTAAQRQVVTTLAELGAAATAAALAPPAVFIIGGTVRHAATLDWASLRPLWGERLGLFAPRGELGVALELAGAELVEAPPAITPAARVVLAARPLTGFLLRSADEVDALEEERDSPAWGAGVIAWCLSPAATERAARLGIQHVQELTTAAPAAVVEMIAMGRGRGSQGAADASRRRSP